MRLHGQTQGQRAFASEFRLAAVLVEGEGCDPVEDRIDLLIRSDIGENEPLGLHDLAIPTPGWTFNAIGAGMTIRQAPPTRAPPSRRSGL